MSFSFKYFTRLSDIKWQILLPQGLCLVINCMCASISPNWLLSEHVKQFRTLSRTIGLSSSSLFSQPSLLSLLLLFIHNRLGIEQGAKVCVIEGFYFSNSFIALWEYLYVTQVYNYRTGMRGDAEHFSHPLAITF